MTPPAKPELLAPAGNVETFFAALESGADAVYVGAHAFNARQRARNFSIDELARLVAYARGIQRRVYVTVNTLVKEQELPALLDLLDALRRIEPHALIIQDLGVYNLARRLAPALPLHASTQMTLHTPAGARQAHAMGFERVILARECTLDEIVAIRRSCPIEIETFIHGALCYSVSGQCNFSSYAAGKSANRGQCQQFCRRLFEADDAPKPLFAPLDLGAAPILPQLIRAGIHSFKIEGRLKPAEAIAQIVSAYRLLIDAHPAPTKDIVAEARNRLKLALGRKQCTGFYLNPAPGDAMTGEGSTQSGRLLGKVLAADASSFELEPAEPVKVGDRLHVIAGANDTPQRFNVKQLWLGAKPIRQSRPRQHVRIEAPFAAAPGARVMKVIDADAVPEGAKRHGDKKWPRAVERAQKALRAELCMNSRGAAALHIHGLDLPPIESWPSYDAFVSLEEAETVLRAAPPPRTVRLAPLVAAADFPDGAPMTSAELEALRDQALDDAEQRLDAQRAQLAAELETPLPAPPPLEPGVLVHVECLDDAQALLHHERWRIILPVRETLRRDFPAFAALSGAQARCSLALPPFAFDPAAQQTVDDAIAAAAGHGFRSFVAANLGHFDQLAPYRAHGLEILADEPLHALNSAAVEQLRALGASHAVYAQEGRAANLAALIRRTGPQAIVLIVYGKVPLFRSRHPAPPLERLRATAPRETLDVFTRDGLTHVAPRRDYSLRHETAALRKRGFEQFLYDLRHLSSAAKHANTAVYARHRFDPRREVDGNFARGPE